MRRNVNSTRFLGIVLTLLLAEPGLAETVEVEGQPLAANVERVIRTLEFLGHPLPVDLVRQLADAGARRDADELQRQLDPQVLTIVTINPESRVKVQRGAGAARLQQHGFTPVLIKVVNQSTVTQPLRMVSPHAGPRYAGVSRLSMQRQQQEPLRQNENENHDDRFLQVEVYRDPPMTTNLSGLEVEYVVGLIYSSEAGKRETTLGFDVGQGNQDLGFRGETAILFEVQPAIPVRLHIRDEDGTPTMARLVLRDEAERVHPPQPHRLAPDLFFQPHIYRADGEVVLLPPGRFEVVSCRGPEYVLQRQSVDIAAREQDAVIDVRLKRWVDPAAHGFFSGDHHIHAAGCAHYTSPTLGVTPEDMFRQIKGEGLNVGCVLTWGPCYDYQRKFFQPHAHSVSEPLTLIKYDLEISGFGSQALGHVCLLNLKDQTYPGSDGTSTKGWPSWTTPVMRWAKEQGGVTGYAHSASGLQVDPESAARWTMTQSDKDKDGQLDVSEQATCLLPEDADAIDSNGDGRISTIELQRSIDRVADQLPNLAIPEMNGVGAMEICVSTVEGVCDFISAMDTARIQEWNTWYHILNCGFPLKVSGETDFPCMSGRRVGQGRVYVQLGDVEVVDFAAWCQSLAEGRSYVTDGFAHALEFSVAGQSPGPDPVRLESAGTVDVRATVAFAPEHPLAVAHGTSPAPRGPRVSGDTVVLHGPRSDEWSRGGIRQVELIVNGRVADRRDVPADGQPHDLVFKIEVDRSSWVALRHFPQLHTNPVTVLVNEQPIRASRDSARWCVAMTERLWQNREGRISEAEREEARATFARALDRFRKIAEESPQ